MVCVKNRETEMDDLCGKMSGTRILTTSFMSAKMFFSQKWIICSFFYAFQNKIAIFFLVCFKVKWFRITYLTIAIHFVICEFSLFEGDHLFGERFKCERSVWMCMKSWWWWWISFAGYKPCRSMISVTITTRINWNNIQKNCIEIGWFYWSHQTRKWHTNCWKHSSAKKKEINTNKKKWILIEWLKRNEKKS